MLTATDLGLTDSSNQQDSDLPSWAEDSVLGDEATGELLEDSPDSVFDEETTEEVVDDIRSQDRISHEEAANNDDGGSSGPEYGTLEDFLQESAQGFGQLSHDIVSGTGQQLNETIDIVQDSGRTVNEGTTDLTGGLQGFLENAPWAILGIGVVVSAGAVVFSDEIAELIPG